MSVKRGRHGQSAFAWLLLLLVLLFPSRRGERAGGKFVLLGSGIFE